MKTLGFTAMALMLMCAAPFACGQAAPGQKVRAKACTQICAPIDVLTLSDGTKLEGFVVKKVPGKCYVMEVDRAFFTLQISQIANVDVLEAKRVKIASLPPSWQRCVNELDFIDKANGEAELYPQLQLKQGAPALIAQVVNASKYAAKRKMITNTDQQLSLVVACERPLVKVPAASISRIDNAPAQGEVADRVTYTIATRSAKGTVAKRDTVADGSIISQVMGKELVLNAVDGSTLTVPLDAVRKVEKVMPGYEGNLIDLNSCPVLDYVILNEHSDVLAAQEIEGVIVCQDYDKGVLVVQTKNSNRVNVDARHLLRVNKLRNPDFRQSECKERESMPKSGTAPNDAKPAEASDDATLMTQFYYGTEPHPSLTAGCAIYY
ncbi:MAG: hypothetical protein Q4B68_00290 [Bacteroidales bacterium]|nr:hypothetical protein [Bacteroidales bacterium]